MPDSNHRLTKLKLMEPFQSSQHTKKVNFILLESINLVCNQTQQAPGSVKSDLQADVQTVKCKSQMIRFQLCQRRRNKQTIQAHTQL